jgi:hypothetical protein
MRSSDGAVAKMVRISAPQRVNILTELPIDPQLNISTAGVGLVFNEAVQSFQNTNNV